MYTIIDNEAGNIIEHAETIEQAQEIIAGYEAADKKDGTYTPNFYAVKKVSNDDQFDFLVHYEKPLVGFFFQQC